MPKMCKPLTLRNKSGGNCLFQVRVLNADIGADRVANVLEIQSVVSIKLNDVIVPYQSIIQLFDRF
jgi:hypothetical protein